VLDNAGHRGSEIALVRQGRQFRLPNRLLNPMTATVFRQGLGAPPDNAVSGSAARCAQAKVSPSELQTLRKRAIRGSRTCRSSRASDAARAQIPASGPVRALLSNRHGTRFAKAPKGMERRHGQSRDKVAGKVRGTSRRVIKTTGDCPMRASPGRRLLQHLQIRRLPDVADRDHARAVRRIVRARHDGQAAALFPSNK